ncbi:MAG: threonine synthase [Anaerolineales bacterium]|nr:threonine synthase [Anaerolineales bacterium]
MILDYEAIKKKYQPDDFLFRNETNLWRYLPLIPVAFPKIAERTPLSLAGGTPVISLSRLARKLGLEQVWLKDESRNPTGSFKDRASAVVVARAIETQAEVVVTASTGNAGAALAGMAAAVGQKAVIFAPKTAPPAKVAQLLVFGAKVLLVDGSYDDAFDLTVKAAEQFGWYCRNTGYNPFTLEGKKTAAFEIWEWMVNELGIGRRKATGQLAGPANRLRLTILASVGDGNIISGIHKGFKDLHALGWLDHIPRLIGVQAEGSAAIANAFKAGDEKIIPVNATTLADSISVDLPRDGVRAVRAASETGGAYLTVSDAEILSAIAELGSQGVFAEPAGAAAYAGLTAAKAQGLIDPGAPVLVVNTGSGLKDIRAAMQSVQPAPVIQPDLESVKKYL